MGVVVLTTDTLHHAYFVRELSRAVTIDWVVLETKQVRPPFDMCHPYEQARDEHERRSWFDGASPGVGEFAETWLLESVNDPAVVKRLQQSRPMAVVVFGTGRLESETIAACGPVPLNLHGGDPSRYRGLDSHLWAVYHRDYGAIVMTLHMISPRLDCGDIVDRVALPIHRGMPFDELRRVNTEAGLRLTVNSVQSLASGRSIQATPQATVGRYYSHMPSCLKSICVDRFSEFTRSLA